MKICIITEGCYPYKRGGVSEWIHDYISACKNLDFVIWNVLPNTCTNQKYNYPDNVNDYFDVLLTNKTLNCTCGLFRSLKKHNKVIEELSNIIFFGKPMTRNFIEFVRSTSISIPTLFCTKKFFEIAAKINAIDKYNDSLLNTVFTLKAIFTPLVILLKSKIPNADIYHSVCAGYAGFLGCIAKLICGKPFILSEHGLYALERKLEILKIQNLTAGEKNLWIDFFYNLSRLEYQLSSWVTSLFEQANDIQIAMGCNKNKSSVISNGIKVFEFSNIDNPPNECVNIGALIRYSPVKDIITMLKAFKIVKKKIKNCNLFIAGGNDNEDYKKECIKFAETNRIDNVFFFDYFDKKTFLSKMHFIVLTSVSEGQPLCVLSSFAAKRPVITTNVGDCEKMVLNASKLKSCGFVCEVGDYVSIAQKMIDLCVNRELRVRLGNNAYKNACENYQHCEMVTKYTSIYRHLIQ